MPVQNLSSRLSLLLHVGAMIAFGCGEGSSPCDEVEGTLCHLCFGELMRCEFDGVEVTEQSCEGCQARLTLFKELCAAGSTATAEEVDAGMTCEVVENTPVDTL